MRPFQWYSAYWVPLLDMGLVVFRGSTTRKTVEHHLTQIYKRSRGRKAAAHGSEAAYT